MNLADYAPASETLRARIALVALGFCIASGCGGLPIEWERWDFPPPGAGAGSALRSRAASWEENLFGRHLSPEGLLLYRTPAEPLAAGGFYQDLADQAAWSGHLLAALSFRAAVEEPAEADRERILAVVRGMRLLHDATGTPGYIARCILPSPLVEKVAANPERWEPSAAGVGFSCRLPPSKDQYAGYVFGLCAARALVDDEEVRSTCDGILHRIAANWRAGGYRIRDGGGSVPRFCDMRPRIFGIPI
ncbi:MAG: hypothetical protein L0Z55_06095 [Planctomycetes bacterium]|nr:hypothetical protein [Planctomycetota bacterium]